MANKDHLRFRLTHWQCITTQKSKAAFYAAPVEEEGSAISPAPSHVSAGFYGCGRV